MIATRAGISDFLPKRVPVFVLVLVLVVAACLPARGQKSAAALSVALAASKPVYAPGEAVEFAFTVENRSDQPVLLRFSSAQRFEAVIEDAAGSELRRWSAGRMFAQMLGEERLGPADPELRYEAALEAPAEPGRYRLRVWLADAARSAAASLLVEVRGDPAP